MNLKEWRGFKGKTPFLPPPSTGKQGRGGGAPAGADSAVLGLDGGPG